MAQSTEKFRLHYEKAIRSARYNPATGEQTGEYDTSWWPMNDPVDSEAQGRDTLASWAETGNDDVRGARLERQTTTVSDWEALP